VPAVPLASSPPSLQIAEQAGGVKRRRYWQGRRVPPSERVGTRQPGVTIGQKLEVLRWVKVWWLPQTEASVVFSDRMYFNRCALCCAVVAVPHAAPFVLCSLVRILCRVAARRSQSMGPIYIHYDAAGLFSEEPLVRSGWAIFLRAQNGGQQHRSVYSIYV